MKPIFYVLLILLTAATVFSSCNPSRKAGCPMNEKIIH